MHIDVKFRIREIVYIMTDPDQNRGVVTGYLVDETSILYRVAIGQNYSYYYDFELSTDKTIF